MTKELQSRHGKYMAEALALAARGRGRTSPNPMVGCVIVKGGKVVGRGWHRRAGGPHAEVIALKQAGAAARGATMYINLEPCSHQGRTPPCAPAVAAAGIARVVAAMKDPNPAVSGRGFAILKKAGVEVISGVMEPEARRLNEAFIKYILKGKPFVILKGAITLDGKIAASGGDSKWITCEAARRDAHHLRSEVDAVLVGTGTLLQDDPRLTVRVPGLLKQPYRVALDARLSIRPDSHFCELASDGKTIVAALPGANEKKARRLEALGVRIIRVQAGPDGRISIDDLLKKLAGMEISTLLVEGGGEVNFSFLESGEVDRLVLYMAPRLLGGRKSHTFIDGAGFGSIASALNVTNMEVTQVGNDLKISGDF